MDYLQSLVQEYYDTHLEECSHPEPSRCHYNMLCENALYFIRQEKEYQSKQIEHDANRKAFSTYIEHLHVTGTQSLINTGTIQNSIIDNSRRLETAGESSVSQSILKLAQAIADLKEIDEESKSEHLSNLDYLSQQALLPKEERVQKSVIKSIVNNTFTALNTVSSISTIAGITLRDISDLFFESANNAL